MNRIAVSRRRTRPEGEAMMNGLQEMDGLAVGFRKPGNRMNPA